MVALLLVTHGDLANALVGSAKLIMGEAPLVESYGLYHGDDIDALKDTVKDAIVRLEEQSGGDGVLVLTDLLGGSPYNATARSFYELSCIRYILYEPGRTQKRLLDVRSGGHR